MARKAKRSKKRSSKKKSARKSTKRKSSKRRSTKRAPAARSASRKDSTGWAILGTIPILGWILMQLLNKNDNYAMFYAKQGLALGIWSLVFFWLPPAQIVVMVLWVLSLVNAVSGEKKPTPLCNWLAKKF